MKINDELINNCKVLAPMKMLEKITNGNVRGLDKIAVQNLVRKKRLPDDVFNLLLVYFFDTFGGTIYDRKDFGRLYLYWYKNNVFTFTKALEMVQLNIQRVLDDI